MQKHPSSSNQRLPPTVDEPDLHTLSSKIRVAQTSLKKQIKEGGKSEHQALQQQNEVEGQSGPTNRKAMADKDYHMESLLGSSSSRLNHNSGKVSGTAGATSSRRRPGTKKADSRRRGRTFSEEDGCSSAALYAHYASASSLNYNAMNSSRGKGMDYYMAERSAPAYSSSNRRQNSQGTRDPALAERKYRAAQELIDQEEFSKKQARRRSSASGSHVDDDRYRTPPRKHSGRGSREPNNQLANKYKSIGKVAASTVKTNGNAKQSSRRKTMHALAITDEDYDGHDDYDNYRRQRRGNPHTVSVDQTNGKANRRRASLPGGGGGGSNSNNEPPRRGITRSGSSRSTRDRERSRDKNSTSSRTASKLKKAFSNSNSGSCSPERAPLTRSASGRRVRRSSIAHSTPCTHVEDPPHPQQQQEAPQLSEVAQRRSVSQSNTKDIGKKSNLGNQIMPSQDVMAQMESSMPSLAALDLSIHKGSSQLRISDASYPSLMSSTDLTPPSTTRGVGPGILCKTQSISLLVDNAPSHIPIRDSSHCDNDDDDDDAEFYNCNNDSSSACSIDYTASIDTHRMSLEDRIKSRSVRGRRTISLDEQKQDESCSDADVVHKKNRNTECRRQREASPAEKQRRNGSRARSKSSGSGSGSRTRRSRSHSHGSGDSRKVRSSSSKSGRDRKLRRSSSKSGKEDLSNSSSSLEKGSQLQTTSSNRGEDKFSSSFSSFGRSCDLVRSSSERAKDEYSNSFSSLGRTGNWSSSSINNLSSEDVKTRRSSSSSKKKKKKRNEDLSESLSQLDCVWIRNSTSGAEPRKDIQKVADASAFTSSRRKLQHRDSSMSLHASKEAHKRRSKSVPAFQRRGSEDGSEVTPTTVSMSEDLSNPLNTAETPRRGRGVARSKSMGNGTREPVSRQERQSSHEKNFARQSPQQQDQDNAEDEREDDDFEIEPSHPFHYLSKPKEHPTFGNPKPADEDSLGPSFHMKNEFGDFGNDSISTCDDCFMVIRPDKGERSIL